MIGNCSISAINGRGIDAKLVDANHVRIRTAKEFFYLDKANYAYEGVVSIQLLYGVLLGSNFNYRFIAIFLKQDDGAMERWRDAHRPITPSPYF